MQNAIIAIIKQSPSALPFFAGVDYGHRRCVVADSGAFGRTFSVTLRGGRERGVSAGGGEVRVLVLQVSYCLFKRQF